MTWQIAGVDWSNSGTTTTRSVTLTVAAGQKVVAAHCLGGSDRFDAVISADPLVGGGWNKRVSRTPGGVEEVSLNVWEATATGSGTLTVTVTNSPDNCSLHVWTDPDTTRGWVFEENTVVDTVGGVEGGSSVQANSLTLAGEQALTDADHATVLAVAAFANFFSTNPGAGVAATDGYDPPATADGREFGHRLASAVKAHSGTDEQFTTASWEVDRHAAAGFVTFTAQPAGGNQPPVADAGVDTTGDVAVQLTRTGTGTDPDGTVADLQWTLLSKPSGSTATITMGAFEPGSGTVAAPVDLSVDIAAVGTSATASASINLTADVAAAVDAPASGGDAFQADAFQPDAFQTTAATVPSVQAPVDVTTAVAATAAAAADADAPVDVTVDVAAASGAATAQAPLNVTTAVAAATATSYTAQADIDLTVDVVSVTPASDTATWVQRLGDIASRQTIPYLRPPSQAWAANADAPWVTGRRYALGGVGEHVTDTWTFETVWPAVLRSDADGFVAMLKAAAESADARLLVNVAAPHGSVAGGFQFVAETGRVDQQFQVGSSTVSLTLTRVDA